nr:putative late blight resistance protein homolog R1A-10 [Ipomoea trifida]
MAYAAVTSLKETLHLHFLQSQSQSQSSLPLLIYKPKILSLHTNLSFLQEILEKSEIAYAYDNSGMKDLEAEIRDAAFEAEEKIERELTTHYPARGWMDRLACLLRLHGIFNEALPHRQTQMAYTAVTSLKVTLHLHFLQSQPRFPLKDNQEIVNSLYENLGFLQKIPEKSEIAYNNSALKELEAEMRDVAFEAEERIEMELSNIYLQSSSIEACLLRLHEILKQAVKQTDYLKKKLIEIQSEHQFAKGPSITGISLLGSTSLQPADPERENNSVDHVDFSIKVLCHFKLLRVVDMKLSFWNFEGKMLYMANLVHLRYLALSLSDKVGPLKLKLFEHWNMQSFIVRGYGFYNFVHLGQLEKLSINKWHLKLPDSGIPWATGFLPNLKKLKFFGTNLSWNDMRVIGMLPNLEVLKLVHACEGKEWEPSEGGFRQLKRLVIESRTLEDWKNVVGDHFHVLQHLELNYCDLLREIPIEFADITTLKLIQLKCCWDSVLTSAKRIQDEQRSYGNEAFLVRSIHTRLKKEEKAAYIGS